MAKTNLTSNLLNEIRRRAAVDALPRGMKDCEVVVENGEVAIRRKDKCPKRDVLRAFLVVAVISTITVMTLAVDKAIRYPVGRSVDSGVYTEPFDPCDPAYKFFRVNYGEPNSPRLQSAPDDWLRSFGDSERTMLLHAVSELRVQVALQGRRILALEDWKAKQPVWDANSTGDLLYRKPSITVTDNGAK